MNREILVLADALAREKSVPKEVIFEALEQALASATKRLNKERIEARVEIDRESGDYKSFRRWLIVPDEEFVDPDNQMMLREAHEFDTSKLMAEYVEEPLEPIPFGRIGAQAAKQVILQKVRDAEREQVLEEFLDRNDQLINGTVRRIDRGNIIVESGRVEGVIPRDQLISKENFRVGDRVRAYVLRIDRQARGPQLILSRTAPQFVSALFELEVPEIEEGVIEIKAVARDPGSCCQRRQFGVGHWQRRSKCSFGFRANGLAFESDERRAISDKDRGRIPALTQRVYGQTGC